MQATISLHLTENAFHLLENVAKRQQRSVADLVEDFAVKEAGVPALEPDFESELLTMETLSTEMLTTFARIKMGAHEATELENLLAKNERSQAEDKRLEALVGLGERIMLRKATALDILHNRGQEIHAILPAA